MAEVRCPGLPAYWVNGWLAAVGATVLVPGMRLRWTEELTPVAVLSVEDGDPVELLAVSWPNEEFLRGLPVANDLEGTPQLRRNVSTSAFVARAVATRGQRHSWTLASTLADLLVDEGDMVGHGRFNLPAPQGQTLWDRLLAVHRHVEPEAGRLDESLGGRALRIRANGLGFDIGRLGSLADEPAKLVDPVVEFLAFFGLAVLPVRGPGVDAGLGGRRSARVAQRGWLSGTDGVIRFVWPAWLHRLDLPGIDALLDVWKPFQKDTWGLLGVRAGWKSVSYRSRARLDPTRAIGSERL